MSGTTFFEAILDSRNHRTGSRREVACPMRAKCSGKRDLGILHLNIQCLRNKVELLDAFLQDGEYDVVSLSEHWLTYHEVDVLRFSGYNVVSSFCRSSHIHGGVLVLARDEIKCIDVPWVSRLSVELICEVSSVYLPNENLIVITAYRTGDSDVALFEDRISRILTKVSRDLSTTIVLNGDFNIQFNKNIKSTINFLSFLSSFGLARTIFDNTRGKNCIDNVFTNAADYHSGVGEPHLSDHCFVYIRLTIDRAIINRKVQITSHRPITSLGLFALNNRVQLMNWSFLDADDMPTGLKFRIFTELIVNCSNDCFPEKKLKPSCRSGLKVEWFTDKLRSMREILWTVKGAAARAGSAALLACARYYQSVYKKEIGDSKKRAYDRFIYSHKNISAGAWKVINRVRCSQPNRPHASLTPDIFNSFFASVTDTLRSGIPQSRRNFAYYLELSNREQLPHSFDFHEVTPIQVRDAVFSLGSSNSRDMFGLNSPIIKCIGNYIYLPLTKLINMCIRDSIVPDVLKTAIVVPLHKKGSNRVPDNFRPISLLPVFGKVLEKLLKSQLEEYFLCRGLFSRSQFVFRAGLSTADAINHLIDHIYESFNTCG